MKPTSERSPEQLQRIAASVESILIGSLSLSLQVGGLARQLHIPFADVVVACQHSARLIPFASVTVDGKQSARLIVTPHERHPEKLGASWVSLAERTDTQGSENG